MSHESDVELLNAHKAQLRRACKDRRSSLDDAQRRTYHKAITSHLDALLTTGGAVNNLAVYFSSPHEVNLAGWMAGAWCAGKRLYAPVVTEVAGAMNFYAITPHAQIQLGCLNLRAPVPEADAVPAEPRDLDAVLLPLVGFDALGGRLGMGGGFYDRYFADPKTRPWMIGVAYDIQESEELLPTQPWDVPLDALVTESGSRIFDRATSHQH